MDAELRLVVRHCRSLGHVPADDLIDIVQRDVLEANGAEGGLPVLWFLFDVRSVSI